MLDDVEHHRDPFPHVTSLRAADPATLQAFRAVFDRDLAWQLREGGFYQCSLCDVTDLVDPGVAAALRRRASDVLGVPLSHRVQVTAQRMDPGQEVLVHTDEPAVGYETARIVVYLDSWREGDGGVLDLGPGWSYRPEPGFAFAFAPGPLTRHAVTQTAVVRRSVVFNLWHIGNTPEVARMIAALFDGMRFDALPPSLDPIAADAEGRYGEEPTLRAGATAWALHRWGARSDTVIAGYLARFEATVTASPEIALATWAAQLHLDGFDAESWEATSRLGPPTLAGALGCWRQCFPISAGEAPTDRGSDP